MNEYIQKCLDQLIEDKEFNSETISNPKEKVKQNIEQLENFMMNGVISLLEAEQKKQVDSKPSKKRKYYRKCGLCGKRYEQSDMVRTNRVDNGWLCHDCYEDHLEPIWDENDM